MKLRICKHCKVRFRPARADAEFCGSLCRQAAYRMRKSDEAAEDARRRAERKAREAAEALRIFEMYQYEATRLHLQAEEYDIKDIKFIGTGLGCSSH